MAKQSEKLRMFMEGKFHKLKQEGMPHRQQIAVVLNMARQKGFKVPKPK